MATIERRAGKRNRSSAKRAGAKFEIELATYLRTRTGDQRIDRQPKNGTKDLGDIAGLAVIGHPIVIECKNTASVSLPAATREARIEADNLDDAGRYSAPAIPVVIHKRHGAAAPEKQWVTMELEEFMSLIEVLNTNYPTAS